MARQGGGEGVQVQSSTIEGGRPPSQRACSRRQTTYRPPACSAGRGGAQPPAFTRTCTDRERHTREGPWWVPWQCGAVRCACGELDIGMQAASRKRRPPRRPSWPPSWPPSSGHHHHDPRLAPARPAPTAPCACQNVPPCCARETAFSLRIDSTRLDSTLCLAAAATALHRIAAVVTAAVPSAIRA